MGLLDVRLAEDFVDGVQLVGALSKCRGLPGYSLLQLGAHGVESFAAEVAALDFGHCRFLCCGVRY